MSAITPAAENNKGQGTQIGEKALHITQDALEQFLSSADVNAAYAAAVTHEKTMIIPAAEVVAYMGVWLGGNVSAGGKEAAGGSGGVGKVISRPVDVIVSDERGVRVKPAMDVSGILRTVVTAAGIVMAVYRIFGRRKT